MKLLLKLGGAALTSPATLAQTADLIRERRARGDEVWLVHGGGPAINEALGARGITWSFVNGQRVTTPEMIDVIEKTLADQVNGQVVRYLDAHDVPSRGISGAADRVLSCRQAARELGQVGEVVAVNTGALDARERVPVIAPLGFGAGGERYNINADWAATHLAVALAVDELLFLTDQDGILDSRREPIREVDDAGLARLIEDGVVQGGMLTKTRAVRFALANGVGRVTVGRASGPERGTHATL